MNRLNDATAKYTVPTITNPTLNFLTGEAGRVVTNTIGYLESNGPEFPSHYLLSTLLSKINTLGGGTIMDIYDRSVDALFDIANAAKISNPTKGWTPTFSEHYPNTHEFWNIERLNARALIDQLKGDPYSLLDVLTPLCVHTHDFTHDADYLPLSRVRSTSESSDSYAVIGIDIPAIAVMYHIWKNEIRAQQEDGQRDSDGKFVTGYLAARMMQSSYDCALINGYLDLLLPPVAHLNGIGMVVGPNHTNAIVEEIEQWGLDLAGRRLRFGQVLQLLPTVDTVDNQRDRLSDMDYTAANAFVVLIADLRRLIADITINPEPVSKTGLESTMSRLRREWKNYRVSENLPNEILEHAENMFAFLETALTD